MSCHFLKSALTGERMLAEELVDDDGSMQLLRGVTDPATGRSRLTVSFL
jgi:hypothetical protein